MPADLLGTLAALASAAVWGGGDFSGGRATTRHHQYQVMVLTALSGMVVLALGGIISRESLPSYRSIFWGAMAGTAGALGVGALYKALSMGHTASVAPTSAIICALIPVAYELITTGAPKTTQLVGFAFAFLGIWLVSRSPRRGEENFRQGMLLGFLAGIGFGGFFLFISFVDKGQVFYPALAARIATLIIAFIMLAIRRLPLPGLTSNPVALLAGFLDSGGNIFYLLATQLTRLDIAALLSSFYPAVTVILAGVLLKEKISRTQWLGVLVCLLALALIVV